MARSHFKPLAIMLLHPRSWRTDGQDIQGPAGAVLSAHALFCTFIESPKANFRGILIPLESTIKFKLSNCLFSVISFVSFQMPST